MILRDYQRAAVDAAHDRKAEHSNTLLVLPTGAGKLAIAGFFVGERVKLALMVPAAMNSPSRITLENNGKIRPQPVRENTFPSKDGGGNGTGIQRSLGPLARPYIVT